MNDEERGLVRTPNGGPIEGRGLPPAGGRTIAVNGRRHVVDTADISHDQLVRLAYPDLRAEAGHSLTVTYQGGPLDAAVGLLTRHQRTPIADGETFVVTATTAS